MVHPAIGRDDKVRGDVVGERLHDHERCLARRSGRREVDREALGVTRDDAEHGLAGLELHDRRPERGAGEHGLRVAEREDPHGRLPEHARAARPPVLADELAERLLHLPRRDDDGPAVEPVANGAADGARRDAGCHSAVQVDDGLRLRTGRICTGRCLSRRRGDEQKSESERAHEHGWIGLGSRR